MALVANCFLDPTCKPISAQWSQLRPNILAQLGCPIDIGELDSLMSSVKVKPKSALEICWFNKAAAKSTGLSSTMFPIDAFSIVENFWGNYFVYQLELILII
ncbi:hypothetical protein QQ045_032114 [Rhodiola kirilowii]